MADNTILNTGTGGDTIRDLARSAGTIKTQVVQLDLGGASANAEVLITAGQQAAAASVPTTASTEDIARTGIITETAPATDTASSGLNGRLQRVAQRLTSLIALLPTSLGQKTMANGLAISIASDQSSIPVAATLAAETTKVIGTVNLAASQTVGTTQVDTAVTGTISATDVLATAPGGAGVFISTAPTVSSFVAAAVPGGTAQADIQITGTATGTYYFEASADSTTGSDGNWIAVNYRQTGIINTVLGYSTTAVGLYRGAPSAFKYIRVRNVGGTTPSNPVIIRYSNGGGTTFLNASIPAGTNIIGKTGIDQTTPGTTNLVALTAETTKVIGTVNVAAAQTIAVTNAGTFAVQAAATLAAETTKVIGTVNVAAGQSVTANAGTNLNTSALNLETTQSAMSAKLPATLGQKAMAASMAVTLASDQASVPVAATLAAETTKVIGTVNLSAAQTLATVTTVSAVTSITNALPAGSNLLGKVGIDQTTPGTTNLVSIGTNGIVALAGKISANAPARNDYTVTSVTTAAYVQLVASTTSATTEVEVFDSSGQTLVFAVGAAASEVIKFNIFPGGNGRVPLAIPAGSRVAIKALSATASVGEINVNFYG